MFIWHKEKGKEDMLVDDKEIELKIDDCTVRMVCNKKFNKDTIKKTSDSLKELHKKIDKLDSQRRKLTPDEKRALILGVIGCVLTIVFGILPLI